MRNILSGYYRPSEAGFKSIWDKCLFVPDANVLLNLYRYSRKTREELLEIFQEVSPRLWVPYQAALEYQRNRLGVISKQREAYDDVHKMLLDFYNKLEAELGTYSKHPLIDAVKLLKPIKDVIEVQASALKNVRRQHPDLLEKDSIRDAVTELLDGKVGLPFTSERLNEIYKEGEKRYEKSIPPGYLDAKKTGDQKFGDLVMWREIIDKATTEKVPVIMITDDAKEDWWWKHKGKVVGPKPELISEMRDAAAVEFYMYQPDRFLEEARLYLGRKVDQVAIDELREIQAQDSERLFRLDRMLADRERMLDAMANEKRVLADVLSDLRSRRDSLREEIEKVELLPDHLRGVTKAKLLQQLTTLERKHENLQDQSLGREEFARKTIAEIEDLRRLLSSFPRSELVIRRWKDLTDGATSLTDAERNWERLSDEGTTK